VQDAKRDGSLYDCCGLACNSTIFDEYRAVQAACPQSVQDLAIPLEVYGNIIANLTDVCEAQKKLLKPSSPNCNPDALLKAQAKASSKCASCTAIRTSSASQPWASRSSRLATSPTMRQQRL